MKGTFCKLSLIAAMSLGSAALVGCDETVSKHEETKVNSDGSTKTNTETVKKEADGSVKTEKSTEKTPPTEAKP